jgi:glycerate 2-kinase
MSRVAERRLRDDALAIWKAGVAAVHAGDLARRALTDIDLGAAKRVAVVGAGKATTAMAVAAEEILGDRIVVGWVNVPDATVRPLRRVHVHGARKLPDNRPTAEGVEGSKRILEIARSLAADDLLLVLLSGGGSALLPLPVESVTLEEKLAVTKLLQESGATIDEMNCVRKHLSQIKGGRLAQATRARVVTLIVSDVIGDPIDVIASGPTAPDTTTFADALAVVERLRLVDDLPRSAAAHLRAGAAGAVEDTPKTLAAHVNNLVIGNNVRALRAAQSAAERLRYAGVKLDGPTCVLDGDTRAAAVAVGGLIRDLADFLPRKRLCVVTTGETTVTLPPDHGKGGRNQEFALAVLDALGPDGLAGVCVLCGGTDGEDGPTDAAGAFIDEEVARAASAKGLDPADFLRRHDAYTFFDAVGGLVRTGPTDTNVMDLRVVLIDRTEGAAVPALARPERRAESSEEEMPHGA